MKITVVRHTSVAVEPGICYGQSNVNVADSFAKEAEIVETELQKLHFNAVFSSPSQRCTKLAKYCGFNFPILDNRLMELNFGDWEMKAWNEIDDPLLKRWYADWINEKITNGESFAEQVERARSFLEEIKKTDYQHVILFTHAGIIRAMEIILDLCPIERAFEVKVDYGQIFQFSI
jgi:alpha-ribazole phosphatase